MRYVLLIICLIVSIPVSAYAVSISEVAWMGSQSSANHEWIELYNPGEATNVDGWSVRDGMNLTITLTGTIPSGSYVILERNRSDGGSVVGAPFLIYTGALVNTGATLVLSRSDGSVVDQVVGGENWQNIGGDNITKETAQYTSSGWVTAAPTPGVANATTGTTPGTTPVTPVTATATVPASGRTILTGTSESEASARMKYAHLPWELDLAIQAPATAQVNQPVTLRAEASGLGPTHLNSLQYSWNFGDLTTGGEERATHTYQYPGTYIITLYATFAKREAVATKRITVLPVQFSLARLASGDVQIYNDATYEVDISGFALTSGGKTIVFPPRSYLSERSSLTIPASRIGNPLPVTLHNQAGTVIASTFGSVASVPTPISPTTVSQTATTPRVSAVATSPSPPSMSPTPTVSSTPTNSAFRFANVASAEETATESPVVTPEREEVEATVTMPASALQPPTPTTPPSPTTNPNWSYGLLVLLLAGAVVALLLFPQSPPKT